ncbi:hypothetical protein RF55_4490 [Lasius niger]|uniref:Endonuclease/exonuclease/phosphatase domain-containing protein n=1 Tax=Lasius niger TaxID=67767 RepID=A0A0J7KYA2_LASNI|nr:hypothetical protein RF55_4490 [Lasius niger]
MLNKPKDNINKVSSEEGGHETGSDMVNKIDALYKMITEIKNDLVGKKLIKNIIKETIKEEIDRVRQEILSWKETELELYISRIVRKEVQKIADGLPNLNSIQPEARKKKLYSEAASKDQETVIIIKPKEEDAGSSEVTKLEIKNKIDVSKLGVGITKMKKATRGAVVVGCENKTQAERLKEKATKDLGEKYVIQTPKKKNLKIKIYDVDSEDSENEQEFWKKIEEQNGFKKNSVIGKILHKSSRKGAKRTMIIAEVNDEAHERMIEEGKVNIDHEVQIDGYVCVRGDSESSRTGGVLLFIDNNIRFELVATESCVKNWWSILVKINERDFKGLLMLIYHSPSGSDSEFIDFLEGVCNNELLNGNIIIMGDFNMDMKVNNYGQDRLIRVMNSVGLKQLVREPTRITNYSETIIDLIFTNMNVEVNVCHEPKITDHSMVEVYWNVNSVRNEDSKILCRNYKRMDADEFMRLIVSSFDNIDTDEVSNVNTLADLAINEIVKCLDSVAPRREIKIHNNRRGKQWFSEEIRQILKKRDEAYKVARIKNKSGTEEGINVEIMKLIVKAAGEKLCHILNRSLEEGIFPDKWKESTVVPIPKETDISGSIEYSRSAY